MDTCRLRVKIGPYEMEAEGPRDFVEKHYGSFSERIPQSTSTQIVPSQSTQPTAQDEASGSLDSEFREIYKVEAKLVTLTAKPTGDGPDYELDGLLLILFGQREMKGTDLVSADELLHGMKRSGYTVERTDRVAARAEGLGLITKTGIRRGTRYRLTNPGVERARKVAEQVLGLL